MRPDAGARPGVALGSKLRHAERKLVSAGWTDGKRLAKATLDDTLNSFLSQI